MYPLELVIASFCLFGKSQKLKLGLMHQYVTDSGGRLPWSNWKRGDVSSNGVARPGWLYTKDIRAVGPARYKVETGLFWPFLKERKLFMCPQDIRPARLTRVSAHYSPFDRTDLSPFVRTTTGAMTKMGKKHVATQTDLPDFMLLQPCYW